MDAYVVSDGSCDNKGEPAYVKLYLHDISSILKLGRNVDKILYSLLKWMTYDNMLMVHPVMKKQIASELGYTVKTVSTYIETLAKGGIMVRVSRGVYQVNPYLIAKGFWKEVSEMRKNFSLVIDYSAKGERAIRVRTRK